MRRRNEKLSIVFNPSWNDWTLQLICKKNMLRKASFIDYNTGGEFFQPKSKSAFCTFQCNGNGAIRKLKLLVSFYHVVHISFSYKSCLAVTVNWKHLNQARHEAVLKTVKRRLYNVQVNLHGDLNVLLKIESVCSHFHYSLLYFNNLHTGGKKDFVQSLSLKTGNREGQKWVLIYALRKLSFEAATNTSLS